MTHSHRKSRWCIAILLAALGAASPANAALFGFTPTNDMVWSGVASALVAAFSPADIMFVAILAHARRCGALR